MKKIYVTLLILLLSILTAIAYTFNQVKTDKEKFMVKIEKVFEGKNEISDGENNSVYLEYRELKADKDSILMEKANTGKGKPTAMAKPLLSGFYYLVLTKDIQNDNFIGYTVDSISSYNIFYRGVLDGGFEKSFREKFSAFTENCYQQTLGKHLQTDFPGKLDEIINLGTTKTDFYFLKKIGPYKKKPEEFYTYSYNVPNMTLFFGSDKSNYTITQDNKKIFNESLKNLLFSIIGISILFLILFLILKILKK